MAEMGLGYGSEYQLLRFLGHLACTKGSFFILLISILVTRPTDMIIS